MGDEKPVSADEAREMLDGGSPCGIDEVVAAGRDILANATVSGRHGVAVRCAADVERLARTVVALHAIIDGRAEAPTDDELAAHHARGARWLIRYDLGASHVEVMSRPDSVAWHVAHGAVRWWSIDADGRPCAWPVVNATAPAPLGVGPRASALCGEDASVNLSRVGEIRCACEILDAGEHESLTEAAARVMRDRNRNERWHRIAHSLQDRLDEMVSEREMQRRRAEMAEDERDALRAFVKSTSRWWSTAAATLGVGPRDANGAEVETAHGALHPAQRGGV